MRRLAIAAALSLIGAAAFAQDVKTDFDKSANFGAIKTFQVKIGTSWNNQISEKRITDEITETLVVDIFDAKSKQLMFRGQASDEISDKPEKNVKKVQKAADKMFKDFPPGSAKK